jgi:hypothetical protein
LAGDSGFWNFGFGPSPAFQVYGIQRVPRGWVNMGEVSRQLHGTLKRAAPEMFVSSGSECLRTHSQAPEMAELIADGFDPVHAFYLLVHHLALAFAEIVSRLPEMRAYSNEIVRAQNRYIPNGPPISPLTASYFYSWSLFDCVIGKTTDTLAGCLIEANDVVGLKPEEIAALGKLNTSRMGVYEHQGLVEDFVKLRELVTNQEFIAHVPSSYRGRSGELWLVRLLPPLLPELVTYHIAFTTPYVLCGASRKDWILFLRRNLVSTRAPSEGEALNQFMKLGWSKNYWNEFIYLAYYQAQPNAIFLSGIPDLQSTLPRGAR